MLYKFFSLQYLKLQVTHPSVFHLDQWCRQSVLTGAFAALIFSTLRELSENRSRPFAKSVALNLLSSDPQKQFWKCCYTGSEQQQMLCLFMVNFFLISKYPLYQLGIFFMYQLGPLAYLLSLSFKTKQNHYFYFYFFAEPVVKVKKGWVVKGQMWVLVSKAV